ncbi:Pmr5/Cas1p GDSL/SGNH-like acyl-esterase family protein [Rhynchospora pubera]|uniref:Pmr5/Cas1p GDSL/SGNH-like acyl-esterase family protein n=1 Tax=Rhynchospora pubera TaxID=906938 RepID=A0AAV8CW23_9POAL|nr:Pmr5/Cas1p GDSL/SGNH-like acyl-esterase family protein [Rhynchospora pubera]
MLPSAQLAIFAASVVIFVPMGLAGLHLSRTKMLFFSGILFIFLFVAVHLAPYFLSISHLLLASIFFPSPPPYSLLPPPSCLPFLHRISWTHAPDPAWSWDPSAPVRSCGFQSLSNPDASILLNGSWILVAGDSQARLLVLALLRLLLDPTSLASVEPDLFKRHSDYHIAIADRGIKIDFLWAPYERNITDLLVQNIQPVPPYPDVLVLGSGLWHMLHSTNSSHYGEAVNGIKEAVFSLHSPVLPHMFWLGLPTLISSKLNTPEKRERMTNAMLEAYGREVATTKILRQSGGPLMLLDIRWLSRGCGARCTDDGMHYNGVVYNAALQIMLNALVIESQQRIE